MQRMCIINLGLYNSYLYFYTSINVDIYAIIFRAVRTALLYHLLPYVICRLFCTCALFYRTDILQLIPDIICKILNGALISPIVCPLATSL